MLESGALDAGSKLPGARRLAEATGMSFPHVQTVVESLVQNGLLESIPRSGTYVQPHWPRRIVPGNFLFTKGFQDQEAVKNMLRERLPQVHLCRNFTRGEFEIRVTHELLANHAEYLDLQAQCERIFPVLDRQRQEMLSPFLIDGELVGIPWIFSPRVILFNRRVLREAGGELPRDGWSWGEFLALVKYLRKTMPGEAVLNWSAGLSFWSNLLIGCRGKFLDADHADPVRIDAPEAIRAIELYVELRELLGVGGGQRIDEVAAFASGNLAMMCVARQQLHLLRSAGIAPEVEMGAVAFPVPEGGVRGSMLAADLFCIRRDCVDRKLAFRCLELMFSEPMQRLAGEGGYGIPFREESARLSVCETEPIDRVFLEEQAFAKAEYQFIYPDFHPLLTAGIGRICTKAPKEIAGEMRRLADALRLILDIRAFAKQ